MDCKCSKLNVLVVVLREKIRSCLSVLIAELCGNEVQNPLREDKYTIKPTQKALEAYLKEEENRLFASAVFNIWDGIDLSEEETEAIKKTMQ